MSYYDEEIDLYILKPYFKREELAAGDGSFKLAPGFSEKLVQLRIAYGKPMIITSGCRTKADIDRLIQRGYQASENSFHLIDNEKYKTKGCCAVDIAWPLDKKDVYEFIREAIRLEWNIRIAPFSYIHIDRRKDYTNLKSVMDFYK